MNSPTPVPQAPASSGFVTVTESEYKKLVAAAETWITKQESWLKRNWVALAGHLGTIATVIAFAKKIL